MSKLSAVGHGALLGANAVLIVFALLAGEWWSLGFFTLAALVALFGLVGIDE